MLYIDQTIKKYLEDLGAKMPAPGGGSVAALTGALAAGLVSMVCSFTVNNPKFERVQEEMVGMISSLNSIKEELGRLIDEDARVYGKVDLACRMPKETEDQKVKRAIAVQGALKEAIKVPEKVLRFSFRVLELSGRLVSAGNPGLITDTGMAAILSYSAMESALLNVEINLKSITDKEFAGKTRDSLSPLMENGRMIRDEVMAKVQLQIVNCKLQIAK